MLPVRPKQTHSMLTRDGIRLDADVYYPDAIGEFPVLLMRQPYGRAIASTVVYAHPSWYAAQGYIVVIQDVRGRGSSEGEFHLFASEIQDGSDSVVWASQLPQSNGSVGLYGFSYQGMTQLYAAIERPPALKALCPAMLAYDLYADWAYEGNAFCLQANLGWAIQLAAETARLRGEESAFVALRQAAQSLPVTGKLPAYPELLQQLAPDSFYHDWITRSPEDPYWQTLSPKTYLDAIADLPMLHIGGWFDPYLRGTLNLYEAMRDRDLAPQALIVGPWAHLPWGRRAGAFDYGAAAVSPVDRLQVRWFDHWLKGIDSEWRDQPWVQLFEMGTNQWRNLDTLPLGFTAQSQPAISRSLYLHPTGLAAMQDAPLRSQPPEKACLENCDTWVHDPWRPVPALGGHAVSPAGSLDRSSLDDRSDVLTYTTEPLEEDWILGGASIVRVTCSADRSSFDLSAVLSRVDPAGRVFNLCQGYVRLDPGDAAVPTLYTIPLQATCIRVAKGDTLRLSLSAACFPAYPVNPGTGAKPHTTHAIDAQIITIHCWGGQVSLPLLDSGASTPG